MRSGGFLRKEDSYNMRIIERAIIFATKAHEGAVRKGKGRPFILHPIEVMSIAASLTDDEEVLAAAVLHDTVEDTPVTREEIELEFGSRVADLVAAESEDKRRERPAESTWLIRKQETIDQLKVANRDTKLICLGDKLSNLRDMDRDYAEIGEELWNRFHQKDRNMHCWYYTSIYDILLAEFGDNRVLREYKAHLESLFS